MANTYSCLYYHIIFSTKNRINFIKEEIEKEVWTYIAGIARSNKMMPLQIGGIENHVHALISVPVTISPSKAVQYIKGGSSKWTHERFPDLGTFSWQDGYGVFTVSKSNLTIVKNYIKNQRQHHKKKTFENEYIEFLRKHEVKYDGRYLLG